MITVGSLFSGIGGFDLGFERAGMHVAWQAELDQPASAILSRHFSQVPNLGDVKNVTRRSIPTVDLICGGFPCQDLSIAGKRKGLAGERSGLWFEFYRVLEELRPRTVVIENVPGLLSSNGGADFAVILYGLAKLGYGVCWRVLDAQYFGLPQRRKRVFIVGSLGDGSAAQILFERQGGIGDIAPSSPEGQGIAAASEGGVDNGGAPRVASTLGGRMRGQDDSLANNLIIPAISAKWEKGTGGPAGDEVQNLVVHPLTDTRSGQGRTGNERNEAEFLIYTVNTVDDRRSDRPNGGLYVNEVNTALTPSSKGVTYVVAPTLASKNDQNGSGGRREWYKQAAQMFGKVRRLTPLECERCQGFPDGWTGGQSDSARYKQLGNAVAVPVAEWIGRRIVEVVR